MAEIRTVRTARKVHRCQNESGACHRIIRPGDRYVLASLPPHSEDVDNAGWWNLRSCAGCVQAHHNQTVDEAATERKRPARRQPRRVVTPLTTVPCRPFRDEPTLHRRITTVHLPAANIPA